MANSDLGAVAAYLKTVSAVTTLIPSGSIWASVGPDGPTGLPVLYMISGDNPDYPMFSGKLLAQTNFTVNVEAITAEAANQALGAVCAALDAARNLTYTDGRGTGTIMAFIGGGGTIAETPLRRSDNKIVFLANKAYMAWEEIT